MSDVLHTDPFTGKTYTGIKRNVAQLLSKRTDWSGKKIVDLCCGEGVTTAMLRSLGADVTPYDLIPDSCKLSDKPGYIDVQAPFPIESNSVDVVVFQEVIEHLPNQLFVIREIYRILKEGGELILTTPSRSSIQAKLSYLVFESEILRGTPWGSTDGVWGQNEKGEQYLGHLFLIGVQQLRALALISGFKQLKVHWTDVGRTSRFFFILMYPFIYLLSFRALRRDLRKGKNDSAYTQEKREQFKLNTSAKLLLSKYGLYSLYK
jgi:SAM-dependent methyltransferase